MVMGWGVVVCRGVCVCELIVCYIVLCWLPPLYKTSALSGDKAEGRSRKGTVI